LITARLKSTRLKRKILLDIDGDTVLDKVINRCKAVNSVDRVILCTSTNQEDAELERYAEKHNIGFFRGDANDVLKRLLDAARQENIDRFLSITADNPLHSILIGNKILDFDENNNCDFIFTQNLPVGMAPYFIKTDALDVVVFMKKDSDTEIWGPYVKQPDFFKIGYLNVENYAVPANKRITCDYDVDYEMIKAIYNNISCDLPDLNDLSLLYVTHPDIFKINEGIIQRQLDTAVIEKIKQDFIKTRDIGTEYIKNKGFKFSPSIVKKSISIL
jgi:spore coat polysaccharide biosynthesis protein SpsF